MPIQAGVGPLKTPAVMLIDEEPWMLHIDAKLGREEVLSVARQLKGVLPPELPTRKGVARVEPRHQAAHDPLAKPPVSGLMIHLLPVPHIRIQFANLLGSPQPPPELLIGDEVPLKPCAAGRHEAPGQIPRQVWNRRQLVSHGRDIVKVVRIAGLHPHLSAVDAWEGQPHHQ